MFVEANTLAYVNAHPYAKIKPVPFYYKKDVEDAVKSGKRPFLIAGFNCNDTIRDAVTITGM